MYKRKIDLQALLKKKSVLLLGPRSTGKSFYVRNQLENVFVINLLKNEDYLKLSVNPSLLESVIKPHKDKIIVIDEIQKIPELLDEVHRLIEDFEIRFLLTGSSARKLKGQKVNLLGGRAWPAQMFPLSFCELGQDFDLNKILNVGSLPQVYKSEDPQEELSAYVQLYIDAEIKTESLVRKIPSFVRFLHGAAVSSGELIHFQNIASDTENPAPTVRHHYSILEDTLIGFQLAPWLESKKRKAIQTSKFFFFDMGVLNQILNLNVQENSNLFGNRFEHFIVNEIRCALSYQRRKIEPYFWRSTAGHEVDCVFGNTAIEIKASRRISEKHKKGLLALREEKKHKEFFVVSLDPSETLDENGIRTLPYLTFLKKLWEGEI
jgi:predicted AAA+ superfamily ATPase